MNRMKWDGHRNKDKIHDARFGKEIGKAMAAVNEKMLNERVRTDEDAIIRTEIHGIISRGLKEGKSKKEVLELLADHRYDKYRKYYSSWIDDRANKINDSAKKARDRLN